MFPWNSLPATLHCSAVTAPRALGVSVTLSRVDEVQPSFLRTITVFLCLRSSQQFQWLAFHYLSRVSNITPP